MEERTSFARGLDELRRTLPYVYGTRGTLGSLELRTGDGQFECWTPSVGREGRDRRRVHGVPQDCGSSTPNSSRRDFRVYRFAREQQTAAAVLVLVEETSSGLEVCLPDPDAPRVFREYPLRSSGFLPVNLVVDGKFEPEQERGGLLMDNHDKSLLERCVRGRVLWLYGMPLSRSGGTHIGSRTPLVRKGGSQRKTPRRLRGGWRR